MANRAAHTRQNAAHTRQISSKFHSGTAQSGPTKNQNTLQQCVANFEKDSWEFEKKCIYLAYNFIEVGFNLNHYQHHH